MAMIFIDTLTRLYINNPNRERFDQVEIADNYPISGKTSHETPVIPNKSAWLKHTKAIIDIAKTHDYHADITETKEYISECGYSFRLKRYINGNLKVDEDITPKSRAIMFYKINNIDDVISAYYKNVGRRKT